jgi:hypothetical protein
MNEAGLLVLFLILGLALVIGGLLLDKTRSVNLPD